MEVIMGGIKMSYFNASLLWFGAAISIAEILTGALLAPLGFKLGMLAIIAGHLTGCVLLYFTGLIGAKSKTSAMESVQFSFGRYGSVFFSVLNILQLVGWTAVMIISGADALASAVNGGLGKALWCIVIGILLIIWIFAGLKNLGKLNSVAVIALLVLSAVLGVIVFKGGSGSAVEGAMSFGMGMELAVAMPVSWLPLISDYTKNADKPVGLTRASTVCYFAGSCLMYSIGLAAALFSSSSDIVKILLEAGLGVAALLIVILATVTTTFLDVYSAGESMRNIYPKFSGKTVGILVSVIGTALAIFTPIEKYQDFLYLIGSVFVPMAAIVVTDYFILKKRSVDKRLDALNAALWAAGFIIYRIFLGIDTVLGSTIPVVFIVMLLCIAVNYINKKVIKFER